MKETIRRFTDDKKQILMIEPEADRCETIHAALSEEYRLTVFGEADQALTHILSHAGDISLIMLDIRSIGAAGLALLQAVKSRDASSGIPVIVLAEEKQQEIDALEKGAADFILAERNSPQVIAARVKHALDAAVAPPIRDSADELTGIPNQETFFRLAEEYDRKNPEKNMDAVSIDISSFHIINDLYGREYGDRILIAMAQEIVKIAEKEKGLAARKSADTFLLYLPHRGAYKEILENLQATLGEINDDKANIIRLKTGVYPNVDKTVDIQTRFDRAKHARDTMHYSFTQVIAYYDGEKYRQDLVSQQLMREIDNALAERQFKVYYQPKFNITGESPVLVGAEALVRWHHPTMGVLAPGAFVPLFEDNGLISRLDRYVWEETAAQIRRWRNKYSVSFPVSVNVSRLDLECTDLTTIFLLIVLKNKIAPEDIQIEITESAYTENYKLLSEQITMLRSAGFHIEMDDFGSGYSSLNMLGSISIDTIKLDIDFIRNMFESEKTLQMLQLMMQIKDSLNVPIVAEGVETKEQLDHLKKIGCDIVQGYYFSKPVLPEEFEKFIKKPDAVSEPEQEQKPESAPSA